MSKETFYSDYKIVNDGVTYIKVINFGNSIKLVEEEEVDEPLPNCTAEQLKYRSPEMLGEESYDAIADWWSLGILIFQMLTS